MLHAQTHVARADQCSNKFDFIAKNVDFPEENKNGDIERFLLYYVT
jgi:endonuclease I